MFSLFELDCPIKIIFLILRLKNQKYTDSLTAVQATLSKLGIITYALYQNDLW